MASDPEKTSKFSQLRQSYAMTRRSDPLIWLWLLGAFVLGAGLGFLLMYWLPGTGVFKIIFLVVSTILFGLMAALIVFGQRAQKAAYTQMHGQKGAAAGALQMLRKGWKTYPAVGFNKQQDLVHRLIGPPGIVLIGEGNHNRTKHLLSIERRKHERVAADVPIHEVICGDGEGEVPLPKLVKHVTKLGKDVKPAEMTDIINRLKALDATRSTVPIPKGPVPTSMKGMRQHMRGR